MRLFQATYVTLTQPSSSTTSQVHQITLLPAQLRLDPQSFTNTQKWYDEVRQNRPDAMIFLVGNKTDLVSKRYVYPTPPVTQY